MAETPAWKRRDPVVATALIIIHAGALLAFVPAFFSWLGVGCVFVSVPHR